MSWEVLFLLMLEIPQLIFHQLQFQSIQLHSLTQRKSKASTPEGMEKIHYQHGFTPKDLTQQTSVLLLRASTLQIWVCVRYQHLQTTELRQHPVLIKLPKQIAQRMISVNGSLRLPMIQTHLLGTLKTMVQIVMEKLRVPLTRRP